MQQRIILIAITTLFTITGILIMTEDPGPSGVYQSNITQASAAPLHRGLAPVPLRRYSASARVLPAFLSIPKLKINAQVQIVGRTLTGNMDTPNNETDVGWYKFSGIPGQPGNAVMTGHLDTAKSKFGVFRDLDKIADAEDVYVQDTDGASLHFRVIKKVEYEYNNAPTKEIFNQQGSTSNLILITCSGNWLKKSGTYSHRTVIYTELIKDEKSTASPSRQKVAAQ